MLQITLAVIKVVLLEEKFYCWFRTSFECRPNGRLRVRSGCAFILVFFVYSYNARLYSLRGTDIYQIYRYIFADTMSHIVISIFN